MEETGYLLSVMEELKRAGLAAPACHAYWGASHDICHCTAADITERIVEEHAVFLKKLSDYGLLHINPYSAILHEG